MDEADGRMLFRKFFKHQISHCGCCSTGFDAVVMIAVFEVVPVDRAFKSWGKHRDHPINQDLRVSILLFDASAVENACLVSLPAAELQRQQEGGLYSEKFALTVVKNFVLEEGEGS